MAYMKKMRKTKMRSKKNARKTKRIRGGASTIHAPNGSLIMTEADKIYHQRMSEIAKQAKERTKQINAERSKSIR